MTTVAFEKDRLRSKEIAQHDTDQGNDWTDTETWECQATDHFGSSANSDRSQKREYLIKDDERVCLLQG